MSSVINSIIFVTRTVLFEERENLALQRVKLASVYPILCAISRPRSLVASIGLNGFESQIGAQHAHGRCGNFHELEWLLELPVWTTVPGEPRFDLAPISVVRLPGRYPGRWRRILGVDL